MNHLTRRCDLTRRDLTPRDWLVAAALAAVVVVLAGAQMTPRVTGTFHDDGVYVSMAKALAEGDGLRLANLPDAPLQRKYPILYPAALAVVWRLWPNFPNNLIAMQAVSVLSAAVFLGFSYLYLVAFRYANRVSAAAAVSLAATTPVVVFFSGQTLSELPFAALLIWSLWRLEREAASSAPRRWTSHALTGVVIGLPFLCRTIGLAVPAAGLALLAWRGRLRLSTVIGLGVTVAPWVGWAAVVAEPALRPGTTYYTDYSPPWTMSSALLARVCSTNLLGVLYSTWQMPLQQPFVWLFGASRVVWPAFVVLGIGMTVALARLALAARPLGAVLVVYLAVVLCWPWPPERFLVPVLPLLLAIASDALARRVSALPLARVVRICGLALCGAALFGNVVLAVGQARENRATGYPLISSAGPRTTVEWRAYEEVWAWLRRYAGPRDVIAAGLDPMVFLYTGRPAVRPFPHRPDVLFYGATAPPPSADSFLGFLAANGVRYLVFSPLPQFAEERLFGEAVITTLRERPGALTVVHRATDPRFVVFEIDATAAR